MIDFEMSFDDPFGTLLRIFYESILSPHLPIWDSTRKCLPPEEFLQLHSFLVSSLVQDYNCRLLLKTGLIDLYKEPAKFCSIFIEHYCTNASLSWTWTRRVLKRWPALKNVSVPVIDVGKEAAEGVVGEFSKHFEVLEVTSKNKWNCASFLLNSTEVLEKSVKYIMSGNFDQCGGFWNEYEIEIAFKSLDDEVNSKDSDSRVLLAQCVCRILKRGGFKKVPDGYLNCDGIDVVHDKNVIISVNSNCSNDHIFVELDSDEFYSQYSEVIQILYNNARIKSICEKYEELSVAGDYPILPDIEQCQFSLIGKSKEEFPIILMLFMWPCVRRYTVYLHRRGKGFDKLNLVFLFEFVKSLARAFDSFYNRNVIIVPQSAPHNYEEMFSKLYLVKSIGCIFKEFIDLCGIVMD